MLLAGDLWFSSVVLVVSIVIPLFGLFIKQKWQLSVARQAEINRLLILASEEDARAELEASLVYGTISVSQNFFECAVCYFPTTTRCARCKAVRYCSTKCQIIHWRQGHKEECHPPSEDKFSIPFGSEGGSISTGIPSVSSLLSSCSEKSGSGTVINVPSNASHPLKSTDAYLSNSRVDVPSVKSERIESSEANAATLAPVSSGSLTGQNGLKTSMKEVVDKFRVSKVAEHYPFAVSNKVAGKYSDKGLFPYESFVKLYNWNKIELQPCGLVNCGNSCYANVVLQCLTFTPPLTAYFLQGLHSKECKKKGWCFSCEFEILILKAQDGKSPLSPMRILSQLQNIGSQLANGKEEDAHEFLRYAIDTMQSACLIDAGMDSSGYSEEETTLVGLTFGGYVRSKIKCMKCQGKSEHHERMMDLTVEIKGDIGSLEETLRQFTATEILDGENKYQCSRCKSYEKAKKKLTILEAPNILTIALKRFQSGRFGKLNKVIRFPEILNLAPYMSGTSDKSPIYRLYAVVVHLDTMNTAFSGHYVCYVKNMQNKWFKIDDNMVTFIELDRVLTKGAYLLLYARCSPRAPRLMRSRNKGIPTSINLKDVPNWSSPTSYNADEFYSSSIHPRSDESFYSKYNSLQRILKGESSSDGSVFSINSDDSCCTDSILDSTSVDDLLDSEYGDSSWSRSRSRNGSRSGSRNGSRNSSRNGSRNSSRSRSRSRGGSGDSMHDRSRSRSRSGSRSRSRSWITSNTHTDFSDYTFSSMDKF